MKIAFPTENVNGQEMIGSSFGRTQNFMLYDTVSHQMSVIKNVASTLQGGAGIKAAQMIIDMKAEILLTPQCGENAIELLNQAKIIVKKSVGRDIQENINFFLDNKLNLLNDIHPGFHHKN